MNDPIWNKVYELLEGYPQEYNMSAAIITGVIIGSIFGTIGAVSAYLILRRSR